MSDRRAPPPSCAAASAEESDLLLREMSHRVGGELAGVSALLGLALLEMAPGAALRLVHAAKARVDCAARLHLHLTRPVRGTVDVGRELVQICRTICAAEPSGGAATLWLDLPATLVPARVARRLLLVGLDLIRDGMGLASGARRGRVSVRIRATSRFVKLRVADVRPPTRPLRAADDPRSLCRDLVAAANGRIRSWRGPRGGAVTVWLPMGNRYADADVGELLQPPRRAAADRPTFVHLASRWGLARSELADLLAVTVGAPGDEMGTRLDPVSRERLLLASGLADALDHLLGAGRALEWLRTPVEAHGWRTPLTAARDVVNLRALTGAAEALAAATSTVAVDDVF